MPNTSTSIKHTKNEDHFFHEEEQDATYQYTPNPSQPEAGKIAAQI